MRHLTNEERELMKQYDDPKTTEEEKAKIVERLKSIGEKKDIFNRP